MSEKSYLHDISAKVSQIVFLAYLTVVRLIKTVCPEMSEISYLRDFSAQVSQIVFSAYLTVLRLVTTVWPEMNKKHISPWNQCTTITKRFLSLFDRFNRLLQLFELISLENTYLRDFTAQVSQIVFLAYLTVLWFITTVWSQMSENSYLRDFSAQVSQIVF